MQLKIIPSSASSEIHNKKSTYNVNQWLLQKNITLATDLVLSYEDIFAWQRGGGETYWTSFKIKYIRKKIIYTKQFVLKAIVTMFPNLALESWKKKDFC